jgi:hypothetical protein
MHSGWCQLAVFINSKPKPMGDIMREEKRREEKRREEKRREEKRREEKRRWIKFKLNSIVLMGLICVNLKLLGLIFVNLNAKLLIQRKLSIVKGISMFLNIFT